MERGKSPKAFEKKSDLTFWIFLGVGIAVVGGLGLADWASEASKTKTTATSANVQARSSTADPVYRCNGKVSFKPCT
jgi:hypothetical protein